MALGATWGAPAEESSTVKSGDAPDPGRAAMEGGQVFTPWMSLSEMNAYFESLDGEKPGGKNYWDRGHWIDEVQGRWAEGIPQYRVSHGAVPESRAHWWFWYLNQDRESFDRLVHQLADEGFTLVHFNSYVRPGGAERFQGVWHKLVPLTHEPPLPAGHYWLSEVRRSMTVKWPVFLVIDGEQISGHGPATEFMGSVRSRFSGTIKSRPIAEATAESALAGSFEREILKLLENADWKEDGNKIRVVKDGETVLRFERDETNGNETPPKQ